MSSIRPGYLPALPLWRGPPIQDDQDFERASEFLSSWITCNSIGNLVLAESLLCRRLVNAYRSSTLATSRLVFK